MLKKEILEILTLFKKYNISEENQRIIFEKGIYFDFTYGDPDPHHRNQHLNVFDIGTLLKICEEYHIKIDINKLIKEPYNTQYEDLIRDVATIQKYSYKKTRRLGK